MKTIKNLKSTIVVFSILMFVSCETENETLDQAPQNQISKEILTQLDKLALNSNVVERGERKLRDGTIEKGYIIERDIFMTEKEIMQGDIYADQGGIQSKQYRTRNLVTKTKTIKIKGIINGPYSNPPLTQKMRKALKMAVQNYNELNLKINFELSFGGYFDSPYDISVYRSDFRNGAGGLGEWPKNGYAGGTIEVWNLDQFPLDVVESVMTHEIGHTIGLRHTDYFSRESCLENTNEGSAGVGAIHIPGTPRGFDQNSIMLACVALTSDGEFNENDKKALNYLY